MTVLKAAVPVGVAESCGKDFGASRRIDYDLTTAPLNANERSPSE